MQVTVRVEGMDRALANLAKLNGQAKPALSAALYKEGEIVSGMAKERVPVKTGALKSTIHVEGPTEKGDHIEVAIVAGGPTAGYAVYVHEDLSKHHPHGEAKFIERPLMERMPKIPQTIREEIARRTKP